MTDHPDFLTFSEALTLLKKSLQQCGLERVNITVSCHDLTRQQSETLAQHLLAVGFGQKVNTATQNYPHTKSFGHFSWLSVAQGTDEINLFYEVEEAS